MGFKQCLRQSITSCIKSSHIRAKAKMVMTTNMGRYVILKIYPIVIFKQTKLKSYKLYFFQVLK
jgi:hypothetical protein